MKQNIKNHHFPRISLAEMSSLVDETIMFLKFALAKTKKVKSDLEQHSNAQDVQTHYPFWRNQLFEWIVEGKTLNEQILAAIEQRQYESLSDIVIAQAVGFPDLHEYSKMRKDIVDVAKGELVWTCDEIVRTFSFIISDFVKEPRDLVYAHNCIVTSINNLLELSNHLDKIANVLQKGFAGEMLIHK